MKSYLLLVLLLCGASIFGQSEPGDIEFLCSEESSPICFSQETTQVGDLVCLKASAQNYDSVAGFQFSLEYDTTLLEFAAYLVANSVYIDSADVNSQFADGGILTIVHYENGGVPLDIAQEEILFELCFTARAPGFAPVSVTDTLIGETLVWYGRDSPAVYGGNFGGIVILACDDVTIDLQATVCEGEVFPFGGTAYASAGTYRDTTVTALGCDSITVLTLTVESVAFDVPAEITYCPGEEVRIDAPAGFLLGLSSTPNDQLQQSLVLSDGTSEVKIFDQESGCVKIQEVDVTELPSVTAAINGESSYCSGEDGVVLTASGGVSYEWSNQELTDQVTVVAGEYSVTVTNAEGCTGVAEFTVQEATNPTAGIEGPTSYCQEEEGVSLTATGEGSYVWSTDEISATINVSAGTYSVTVTNAAGCTDEAFVTIVENASPTALITGPNDYCPQGGPVEITASGGVTYLWSTEEQTATIAVDAGTYTVTVTNESGCTDVASFTLNGDATSPEFLLCPDDFSVAINFGEDSVGVSWVDPFVEDNCGEEGLTLTSNSISGSNFSPGETEVVYLATDAGGNTAECAFLVEVVPTDELTFFIDSAGVTVEGDLFCIPVKVRNYNGVVGWSLGFQLPAFDGVELVSIELGDELAALSENGAFTTNSFPGGAANVLFVNETGEGTTLPTNGIALQIKMRIPGGAGDCFTIAPDFDVIEVSAFREGPGFVVPTVIGGVACYPRDIDITGRIYRCYDDNRPVGAADVNIEDSEGDADFDITDPVGRFAFLEQTYGLDFTITPERDFDDAEGLGLSDLITIIRHVQIIEFITDPCMQIAADVNRDGQINLEEIPPVQELIVGLINEFPENTSWRFFPVTHIFENSPLVAPFPEVANLIDLRMDTVVDFYGVKIGDIDHSAVGQLTENDDNPAINFTIPNQSLNLGKKELIPVYGPTGSASLAGFQQALSFDPTNLKLLRVVPGDRLHNNFVVNDLLLEKGQVRMSWVDTELHSIGTRERKTASAEGPLFFLEVLAKAEGRVSDFITLDRENFVNEAAVDGSRQISPLGLSFRKTAPVASMRLFPNPFYQTTLLEADLREGAQWNLRVMNAMGQVTGTRSGHAPAGYFRLNLTGESFPLPGTYFISLVSDNGEVITRKVTKQ